MTQNVILEQTAEKSQASLGEIVPSSRGPLKVKGKKIWIDLDNSPHVPFFIPIIEELEKLGCEILLTARDTYQVCDLLKFHKLPCRVIGGNYGKNKIFKVLGNCIRSAQLLPTAFKGRPDLAISHGSRAQVLVCTGLGIPTIMMHDYEFTTKTGFLEPTWTLMPDVIPSSVMSKRPERVLKYPGLKEDVYVPSFHPDPSIFSVLEISQDDFLVTLRPPATEAHYHNPESEKLFAATVELLASRPHVRMVTLPRSAKQAAQLRKDWDSLIRARRMIIPDSPVDGLNLIWFSDIVISGGGTMNREAAALGIPVYSVFRGKIGAVDRYLAEHGRMVLLESVDDVRTKIDLTSRMKNVASGGGRTDTLDHIVKTIMAIGESKCPPTQRPRN